MGSYLDKPETTKHSATDENEFLEVGSSSMQGWRVNQEDAHNSILNINGDNVSFFGLYDGHGGAEVAEYCSKQLPEFLKQLKTFREKNYDAALKEAFMGFDAILLKAEVIEELRNMAKKNPDYSDDMEDDEDEEISELHAEASMSLSEVLKKYTNGPIAVEAKKSSSDAEAAPGGSSAAPAPAQSPSPSSSSSATKPTESSSSGAKPSSAAAVPSSSAENQVTSSSSADQIPSPVSTQETLVDDDDDAMNSVEPQCSSSSNSGGGANSSSAEPPLNGQIAPSSSSSATTDANSASSSAETPAAESPKVSSQQKASPSKQKSQPEGGAEPIGTSTEEDSDDEHDETYKESPKKKAAPKTTAPDSTSDDDEEDDDTDVDDEDLDEEDLDDEEMTGEEEEEDEDNAFMNEMETGPGKQSGCTAVVAVLDGRDLYVANAGDSRCVLCRNGKVVEMTADHKPEDEPEFMRIKKAGGRVTLDGRVNGGLNLSRAIGDHGYKMNKDLPAEEQMITALPDLKKIVLEPEDEFMILACDGIWNYMTNEEVIGFIKHRIDAKKPLTAICEELFDNCLAPNTMGDGTGCDNMTAIIVKFKDTIFKQPDSRSSVCKSATEMRKRSLDATENDVQSTTEPCEKKKKIDEELAPSTVDTA